MEFEILGPLEVRAGGASLAPTGARQRTLLAVLLLHANEVVSHDRLIDALWDEQPPATALKALQVHVSQLRKLLEKERLQTKARGYVLRVEEDELDVNRFRRLLDQGDPRAALALWRGAPLAEFSHQRFAQAAIARLEELRLVALEARVDADLREGRHADLVGELEVLIAEHPLRERPRAQLMLALYRSSRQADALVAYQAARVVLVEELGVEPSRALRELHQAILNHDPSLELAADEGEAAAASEVEPLAAVEPAAREARKTVTVACVVVTFVPAAGRPLDPEELRHVSGRAFAAVEAAVARHGGIIETVTGEQVTGVFGLPAVHEDDALRALRAAVEVRTALAELAAELTARRALAVEFGVGISTGDVVTDLGGASQLRTTGEPLRRSSRLAHVAAPGEILFDDAAHRLVHNAVAGERVDGAWRLLAVEPAATYAERRLGSPMVGRARERRRLRDAFEQAVADHSCQLFTVLGAAGVGKSRLVEEFLGEVSDSALVARGRCLPYGEGITYWPLMEVVRDAIGLDDAEPAHEGVSRLAGALRDERDAELVAQQIGELIGLVDAAGGGEDGFGAVRTLLEALARARPLVIVFDDIHWGEARFLDLVEHVAEWTRDAAVSLVCLARPELLDVRPGWAGGKLNATSILLEPLSESESIELIENLRGGTMDERTKQRIVAAAEGNPLFVEEMLALVPREGAVEAELEVPPTIQALLAARLDRLGENERSTIERAAVVGNVFYEGAVVELTPVARRGSVGDALGSLVRKELIRPDRPRLGERAYRFRHLLIRDAAYESVPKVTRAKMHERFGRWLEHAAGERVIEYEEVVGYHLEQAHRYSFELGTAGGGLRSLAREAAERLGAAGRRAFARGDAPAGVNLISRAVALLPPGDPLRVYLVPNVRVVQGMNVDMSWADRALTEAIEAAGTSGDRRLAAQALVQRGLLRLFTEANVTAEEFLAAAERSIPVFDEHRDELGLARAWRLKAQAHYLARRGGLCAEASEHALEHARRAGDAFERREIVEWLAVALFLGPAPAAEAARRCGELLREARGEPVGEVQLIGVLAFLAALQGRVDEAAELIAKGRRLMDELGERVWLFFVVQGFVWLWLDDPVAAERELRPAYDTLKTLGEKSHFSSLAAVLSRAVYAQGRHDEAEKLTHESEAAARANDVHSQIIWRSTRAKVLASRGEFAAADRLAREAVAFAATSDFHLIRAEALQDLADVHRLAGRAGAGAEAVAEATRYYSLKGAVLSGERARTRHGASPATH